MRRMLPIVFISCFVFGGCIQAVQGFNYERLAQEMSGFEIAKPQFDPNNPLLNKRLVFVNGKLNFSVAQSICEQLVYLNEQSNEKTIQLLINSGGGDATAYMAIANMVKSIDAPVDTVNVSFCGSAAVSVFLSATGKRYALQDSAFMIHDVRGSPKDLVKMYSKTQEDLLRAKCDLPADWLPLKDREFIISAEDAEKYKLVDEILPRMKL